MPEFVIDDNGDGSELIRPDEMSMDTWMGLLPARTHWWQPHIWSAADPDKAPEKHMSLFRHIFWWIFGV